MKDTERTGAPDMVVSHVRGLIEKGALRSGDRLAAERELARELGVSRPSVRSGLQALAAMGIVQIRHGAGTFITAGPPVLDAQPLDFLAALHGLTADQVFEARQVLEVAVAGLAAERTRRAPEEVIAISDATAEMFASLDDPAAFLEHEVRFHRAVAAAAGNPVLSSLLEMVSTMPGESPGRGDGRADGLKAVADEHRRIYQAIRGHDAEGARRAMTDHLQRARRDRALHDGECRAHQAGDVS